MFWELLVCFCAIRMLPREENMADVYHIQRLCTCPAHLGIYGVRRKRYYFLLVHKRHGRFVGSAIDLYASIKNHFEGSTAVRIDALFWETDAEELRAERLASFTKKRLESNTDCTCLGLLTAWEREQLDRYTSLWLDSHEDLTDAVFCLSQNAGSHCTWSSKENGEPGQLPTVTFGWVIVRFFLGLW